jgi:hypothetical protein
MRNLTRLFLLDAAFGLGALIGCSDGALDSRVDDSVVHNTTDGGPAASTSQDSGAGGNQAAAGCVPLVVSDPSVSLDGTTQFRPEEKQNNPQAGEPSYVYLAAGREAVVLRGPDVPNAAGLFALESPSIALVGASATSADGYAVIVNPTFRYQVAIDDFEYEVALAQVDLCQQGGVIESQFVFRANPDASGVAFDIIITASAGSAISGPTSPVTVEVR